MNLIAPLTKEQIQSYYTSPITPEEKKEEEVKVEEVTEELKSEILSLQRENYKATEKSKNT